MQWLPGETLEQAVIREAFEEINARVTPITLFNVYEHQRVSRKSPGVRKHKIEFAFLCKLEDGYLPQNGTHPDPHQESVEWIALDSLPQLALSPAKLIDILVQTQPYHTDYYLGMVR